MAKNTKKKFLHDENKNVRFPLDLAAACLGIVFISEADADLEPFVAGVPASRSLRGYLKTLGIDEPRIEEVGFEDFFARLTSEKDWHGPREKKRREQFAKLRTVIEKELSDTRVIRVGRMWIDIYIAGIDANGRLAGVRTKALET